MKTVGSKLFLKVMALTATALLPASFAMAQGVDGLLLGDSASPSVNSGFSTPLFNVDRDVVARDLQGIYNDEKLDINLGMEIEPVNGLTVRADAWRLEVNEAPAQDKLGNPDWQNPLPQLYIENSLAPGFMLEQSQQRSNLEANGIDLGASYVWDGDKLGQFTLSTKATYVYDFRQANSLPETASLLREESELPGGPELQGSLTLTWQLGNHSASAVTNYFDSFKDIGELNIDEINALVENITTFDLQYGYSVKTGKQDRAIISFDIGVRNIFDQKTTQILNQNSRVVDQNGRVAYGSIKYQF